MFTVIVNLHVEPALRQEFLAGIRISERCVVPGTHSNTYATPVLLQEAGNAHPPTSPRNVHR